MKKLILIIILLFTFTSTANAITIGNVIDSETKQEIPKLESTDGALYINNAEIRDHIANLKKHTVIVMLQKEGRAFRGAGIAIDKRHILTVNHAAATTPGSNNYYFAEENGKPYDATVIKTDELHDLALLEIDKSAPDLMDTMTFNNPIAGETIYTIGHPDLGLYSLTMGKTSNDSGRLKIKIHGGNSGGMVMNEQGELIGMITSMQEQVGNLAYMTISKDIKGFMNAS